MWGQFWDSRIHYDRRQLWLRQVNDMLSVTVQSHISSMTLKRVVSLNCLLIVCIPSIPTYTLEACVDKHIGLLRPLIDPLRLSE